MQPRIHTRAARFASKRADYHRLPLEVEEAMRFRLGSFGALLFLTSVVGLAVLL